MIFRIEACGESIAYRRRGKGFPVVLLHGFLCDSRVWRTQLDELSNEADLIAWDAPGAGSSSDPRQEFSFTDWAQCLSEFLSSLAIPSAAVLGLSWGGVLAQEFYRLFPQRVASLILCDTYTGWKGSLPEEQCAARLSKCIADSLLPCDEFVERWVPNQFFTEHVSENVIAEMSTIVADFHPAGFRLMAKSLRETDTREILPGIRCPTLLIWGRGDLRSPLSVAKQFQDAIPQARLTILEDAGHVSNMEQPRAFNAVVRNFLGVD